MFARPVLAAAVVFMLAQPAAAGQKLTLERVLLSQGGVGYFEYEAQVDGDAALTLTVPKSQVDDILKSVVVYDDKGGVGGISLEGEEPLAEAFRKLPFGQDALRSPVELLNALQGAVVTVGGPRPLTGRVLQAVPETVQLPDGGGTVVRHRVTVMTDSGLQQFVLEEADSVSFQDPALSADVEKALEALVANRARDDRTLTVLSRGQGQRTVRVGYVVATPLWKTSYRLTLQGGADAATGLLQGWAIIENLSGQDWKDVDLTLTSGNPVTFHQALYQAYFVDRPEVPVEVMGRVLPKIDEGAMAAARGTVSEAATPKMRAFAKAMPTPEAMQSDLAMAAGAAPEPMPSASPAGGAMAVESREATSQVTFRFPEPVSVPAGGSFAVPIVDRSVPAERVALYEPETHGRHPLLAVDFTNDGGTGLPPGVLTLYEQGPDGTSYVGDARMGPVPTGEERLLSFSLDSKTVVDREQHSDQQVGKGSIADGLFRYTWVDRQTTTYRLKAPANEPRRLILSQPRRTDWRLVKPDPSTVELTDTAYRLSVDLAAGEERTVEVVLERPRLESLRLVNLDLDALSGYAQSSELSPELRKAFAEMARLKRAIDDARREQSRLEGERSDIVNDQGRLRDNLGQVPENSDLHRRYLAKLTEQEDRLEQLDHDIAAATLAVSAAEDALRNYISGLSL